MKHYLAVVVTLLGSVLAPQNALACSCPLGTDLQSSFDDATIVVAATAIAVSTGATTSIPRSHGREVRAQTVEWEVVETWKGQYQPKQRFTTQTIVQCCVCGYSTRQGVAYILYLYKGAPLTVSSCSRTSELVDALKDVPELYRLSKESPNGT